MKMLTTYTFDTLLVKFEVGAKPRARDSRLYALGYCTSVAASAPASLGTRIGIGVVVGVGVVGVGVGVGVGGNYTGEGRRHSRGCGEETEKVAGAGGAAATELRRHR